MPSAELKKTDGTIAFTNPSNEVGIAWVALQATNRFPTPTLDFAPQAANTSAVSVVLVENTGGSTLTVIGATLSNTTDFGITHNCPASVTALAHCNVMVTSRPASTGAKTGNLTIASSAGSSVVALRVNGITGTGPLRPRHRHRGSGTVSKPARPAPVFALDLETVTRATPSNGGR